MKNINKSLNIIYLCTADKGPSGGAKTIYNHSESINKLKIPNLTSEILHIKKKKTSRWNSSIKKILRVSNNNYFGWNTRDITVNSNFKNKWFKNNIKIKKDFKFDKSKDFVIFPEIFAHFADDLCIKNKINFGIFIQNGYCLNPTNNHKKIDKVYKNSKFLLSYSKDISNCIKLAFPECKKKILKTNISIDAKKINLKAKKENMITYMPRKLPTHSDNLIFFLRNKLPKTWKFKSLNNLDEKDIYKYLSKSKIFLSFSNMEGLGIPPIEAAIAGNKVIGYVGQGGSEYWKKPIFTEVNHGDISKFIKEIFASIKNKKIPKEINSSRRKIIKKYSVYQKEKFLLKMINKIISFR